MGINNMINTIKSIHNEDIAIVKIGKFYHTYGRDSHIIAYLFNYKLKTVEGINLCGFSENCINKVRAKLEAEKINYLILNRKNNYEVEEKYINGNLNRYSEILGIAKQYILYKARVDKIYEFMMGNISKGSFREKLRKIEEILNE